MEQWNPQFPKRREGGFFHEVENINTPSVESQLQQSLFQTPGTFYPNQFSGQHARHGDTGKAASSSASVFVFPKQDAEHLTLPRTTDFTADGTQDPASDALKILNSALAACSPPPLNLEPYRDAVGPIFDIPFFCGYNGSCSSMASVSNSSKLSRAYGTQHQVKQKQKAKAHYLPSPKNVNQLTLERARNYIASQEVGRSNSLQASQRTLRMSSPSMPSLKFSSSCAVDATSKSALKGKADELVEKEITAPTREHIAINAPEPSLGNRTITSVYTRRPITSESKMSDMVKRQCRSVISELQARIMEEGHLTVPHLAYSCTRSANNMTGIHLLDFQKICQSLDEAKYCRIKDFLADCISMFESSAQEFGFSREMRSEVIKVEEMFSDLMKSKFPSIDIPKARFASSSTPNKRLRQFI